MMCINIFSNDADVIIEIQNNGKAIQKKDLDKVFDSYFSTKKEGSGIGLHLSKIIIQRSFDGEIKASNKDDKVVFTINLAKTI